MKDLYSAMILAGGKGKRMGNVIKANLTFEDTTFLAMLEQIITSFPYRYLSANDEIIAEKSNLTLVKDLVPGLGPMGGLYSVLKQSPCNAVLVIPCDMPFFSQKLVDFLIEEHKGEPVIYLLGKDGREYPLCGIYTKDCLSVLEDLIHQNDLRMRQILKRVGGRMVPVPEELLEDNSLCNINTPEVYQKVCNPDIMRNRVGLAVGGKQHV